MKYVDEFRDPDKAQVLSREIRELVKRIGRTRKNPLQIMEVCGGHTHSIFRYGITQFLPEEVEFVHGPGCPVCVLPMGRVDDCVALAEWICDVLDNPNDEQVIAGVRANVELQCRKFPVYAG